MNVCLYECRCCNTCEDVRTAYQKKGWAFLESDNIEQCAREGYADKLEASKNEGCHLFGYLEVSKVSLISCNALRTGFLGSAIMF